MRRRIAPGELGAPPPDLHSTELGVIVYRPVGEACTAQFLVIPAEALRFRDTPIAIIVSPEATPELRHEPHNAEVPIRPTDQRAVSMCSRIRVAGPCRLCRSLFVLSRQLENQALIR